MTLRKPALAVVATLVALTGGLSIAETAEAQTWRGRPGASLGFSFGTGPAYGYGYYGRPYYAPYGWNNAYRQGYYAPPGRYYAPPRWRGRAPRYRACDRWVWDGWRQTYVLVRGRC